MCVRVFRVNKVSLIYRCSLLYIHCSRKYYAPDTTSSVNICYTDPGSLLYLVSDTVQVNLLVSLSVKWYICLSRDSNQLSHDPEALSWTKHVERLVCMTRMTSIMSTSLVLLCYLFGFNVAFSNFFSHITMVSACDRELNVHFYFLLCCVTEVSCPRHLNWHHAKLHYPDTASTSPSYSP